MDRPLVSVVIAVKNGERFLASAIESVLGQDYRPIEIIVVDGQSEDKTAEIAQSFDQVRYVWQVNKGVADAYNVGIAAAEGELVAFLSHDDLWTPDKLSVQVGYMMDRPELQYTIARVKFFLEPGCLPPPGFRKELLENDHVGRIMETLVVRQSLYETVGGYDTQLSIANDVDWYARAEDSGIPMAIIPKVLLHKRIHDANVSMNIAENNRNLLRALRQSVNRKRRWESGEEQ